MPSNVPSRAPFVRHDRDAGLSEVDEVARGQDIQRAVRQLVICPYCIGLRVASASDFVHLACTAAVDRK